MTKSCQRFLMLCHSQYDKARAADCTCEAGTGCKRAAAETCGCGHHQRDHFDAKGVCSLGFCSNGCSTFS